MFTHFFQVNCALLYSRNGTFEPPSTKNDAAFSRANWGDFKVKSVQGLKMKVKHVTLFLKRIQVLKPEQWDNIFKTVTESVKQVGTVESDGEHQKGGLCTCDDNDNKLLDPMYNELLSGS
jgi:hypothetical protein